MKKRSFLLALPVVALAALFLSPLSAGSGSLKILKFEADWCGACKQMKPVFASVARETKGVTFETVNVDRQESLSERYDIEFLPTIVAVKDGREVGRLTGAQSAAKLKKFVKKHE